MLPDPIAETIARITVPESSDDTPAGLDGELGSLRVWWRDRVGTASVRAAFLESDPGGLPTNAADALICGLQDADRAIDAGATILVPRVSERQDSSARAVIGLLAKKEASAVIGQPAGVSDHEWMDACAAIRDLMATHRDHGGEYLPLLDGLRTAQIAWVAGVLLGSSARCTPGLIDGTDEWAGALIADRLSHRARHWWRGASTSPDPGRTASCERIGIDRGLPLELSDDEALGAQSTLAVLRIALGETVDGRQ